MRWDLRRAYKNGRFHIALPCITVTHENGDVVTYGKERREPPEKELDDAFRKAIGTIYDLLPNYDLTPDDILLAFIRYSRKFFLQANDYELERELKYQFVRDFREICSLDKLDLLFEKEDLLKAEREIEAFLNPKGSA